MKTHRAITAASSAFIMLSLGSIAIACGSSGDGDGDLDGLDTGGGLTLDGGDEGGNPFDAIGDPDSRIDPDAACAAESYDAKRLPPNLYLLFDHSGSMKESVSGGTKWTGSVAAISSLVTKSTDDLKMGLKLFPPVGAPDKTCTASFFATPDVPVAPLSTSRNPILCHLGGGSSCGGITAAGPDGNGTPMAIALDQAIKYMATAYKGEGTRVVVLITDGDPNGCGDIGDVITAATKAPSGTEKVIVYVIGAPGGTVSNLSRVAEAGGGKRTPTCVGSTSDPTKACHYQIGGTSFEKDLTAALEDIKGKALTCTFNVPAGASGSTVDKSKVNVNETAGGVTSTLPQDPSHTNGWDYTDGGATITVYGPECDKLKADPTVKIQIILGCKTKGPA